jgi:hypothetical protein
MRCGGKWLDIIGLRLRVSSGNVSLEESHSGSDSLFCGSAKGLSEVQLWVRGVIEGAQGPRRVGRGGSAIFGTKIGPDRIDSRRSDMQRVSDS